MCVCCRSPTHLSALPAQLLSQGDEHEQLEQLETQVGLSGSQFSSKFFAAFVLSLAQTLLLLDLLKVILLTLTSGPSLNALLPRGTFRHRLLVKSLRRLHNWLAAVL